MKKTFKIAISVLVCIAVIIASIAYITSHNIAVMEPKGAIGVQQRDLINTAFWLMSIVVIPVFIMTIAFAWRYRKGNKKAKHTPDWDHSYVAEIFWWGVPFIIIIFLAIITWTSSHALNPYKPIENGKKPIVIQVVALDWKWLFIYPEQGIATVNFIQFPVNTPLNFEITADAPMNSFWIPQLGGQIYAMPAMKTKLHLIANEIGVYRGSAANISGDGFAGMTFKAQASSQEDFDQWVQTAKQSSNQLNQSTYDQLMKPSSYHPVTLYVLTDGDLFNHILMKYDAPKK
jgi:cytochrome o ubiquinol oxidase subunit 2